MPFGLDNKFGKHLEELRLIWFVIEWEMRHNKFARVLFVHEIRKLELQIEWGEWYTYVNWVMGGWGTG